MSPDPTDDLRDFDDPEVPTDANPSRLRRLILAQHDAPGGAAVALFTSATLTADPASGGLEPPADPVPLPELPAGPGPVPDLPAGPGPVPDLPAGPGPVPDLLAELGLDPERLRLFSFDAYVLQSALGEQWLGPR